MQKKKVVLIVGSICIGIIIVLFLLQSIFATVRTKNVEDVPRTIFLDINELDSIPGLTLISKQTDSKDGDYEIVEKREYLWNIYYLPNILLLNITILIKFSNQQCICSSYMTTIPKRV